MGEALGFNETPVHADDAPMLAVTTGDLELKLSSPPEDTVEATPTDGGAPEGILDGGGGPNGDEGAGQVAGVVELPLLKLLTLLL